MKVKCSGAAPKNPPKPVAYAEIDGQGRIPYGKTAPAPMAGDSPKQMKTRGTGKARRGTMHKGC